ncbi:MAG: DUF3363 domain-containing protein [Hyphomonas sp.]|nr:DUF3363 domain-containing protein [Hyphomonas sp.]
MSAPRTKPSFTGARIGKGKAAGLHARIKAQRLPRMRLRRVVVKVHIARAKSGIGIRAYSRHIDYIQRDGVDRDGSGGQLYGRDDRDMDGRAFAERSMDDRHQFRIIVSPEDADQLDDLEQTTRRLMLEVERDLGTRLDWVAVDHHNTGHPHTHIVIRGKDDLGQDLVIARDYLMKGIRARAEETLTQELGPRRDIEIVKSRHREVLQDRFTGLDREIDRLSNQRVVELSPGSNALGRFTRSLHEQRLSHLEQLHLAKNLGEGRWQLTPRWDQALKAMGRKGDIIRALAAGVEPGKHTDRVRFFEERTDDLPSILGQVIQHGPQDELRDRRFILVEDFQGTPWYAPVTDEFGGASPPIGAVVELSVQPRKPRRADRTIAEVADRSGGLYSDELHAAADPSASSAYRLAHKRRLEALRRAGIVNRSPQGEWDIAEDFLERAAEFESAKRGGVAMKVHSWASLKAQIEAYAETWLDREEVQHNSLESTAISEARNARVTFLRGKGWLKDAETTLNTEVRQRLRLEELRRVGEAEAERTQRSHKVLETGEGFEGKFERTTDLAQGRMAIVGNEKAFALVPWRPDMERQRGRSLVVEARERGVTWNVADGLKRGLSR